MHEFYNFVGPITQKYAKHLSTAILGKVIPTIAAEYGDDKALDIMLSGNHELFQEAFPGAEPSRLKVQPDGSIKVFFNMHVDLFLDET